MRFFQQKNAKSCIRQLLTKDARTGTKSPVKSAFETSCRGENRVLSDHITHPILAFCRPFVKNSFPRKSPTSCRSFPFLPSRKTPKKQTNPTKVIFGKMHKKEKNKVNSHPFIFTQTLKNRFLLRFFEVLLYSVIYFFERIIDCIIYNFTLFS